MCLFLNTIDQGEVTVTPDSGEPVKIKAGDMATFPKGDMATFPNISTFAHTEVHVALLEILTSPPTPTPPQKGMSCTWDVTKAINKHYNFD